VELDQPRLNLKGLIEKLRQVTLAVQIMPFIYTLLYLVAMICYWSASELLLKILDSLFYISPVVVIQFLVLSRSLRLCIWHKVACTLPLMPQVAVLLDSTVMTFSENLAKGSVILMALMSALLLIAAYKVFFS
jgi:hypothetical protein